MHRSTWKVSFGEVDYAGIVYYPNFFDYFQRTEEEFMERLGFPYPRLHPYDHRLGWVCNDQDPRGATGGLPSGHRALTYLY